MVLRSPLNFGAWHDGLLWWEAVEYAAHGQQPEVQTYSHCFKDLSNMPGWLTEGRNQPLIWYGLEGNHGWQLPTFFVLSKMIVMAKSYIGMTLEGVLVSWATAKFGSKVLCYQQNSISHHATKINQEWLAEALSALFKQEKLAILGPQFELLWLLSALYHTGEGHPKLL